MLSLVLLMDICSVAKNLKCRYSLRAVVRRKTKEGECGFQYGRERAAVNKEGGDQACDINGEGAEQACDGNSKRKLNTQVD
jgi:hypothetical protein